MLTFAAYGTLLLMNIIASAVQDSLTEILTNAIQNPLSYLKGKSNYISFSTYRQEKEVYSQTKSSRTIQSVLLPVFYSVTIS